MIDVHNISTHCTRSEFVGTAVLDTIGLVISGIDDTLLNEINTTVWDYLVPVPEQQDRSLPLMMR